MTFTGLLIAGHLDKASYVTLTLFALGGYLGANVAQRATAKPSPAIAAVTAAATAAE